MNTEQAALAEPIPTTLADDRSRALDLARTASALLIPLRLSWTYFVLIPAILYQLFEQFKQRRLPLLRRPVAPYVLFLLTAWCSAPFGIGPAHSLLSLLRLSFCSCAALLFSRLDSVRTTITMLLALLIGQAIAALHSSAQLAFPDLPHLFFVGPVTESGQLALGALVCLGLLFFLREQRSDLPRRQVLADSALAAASFCILCSVGLIDQAGSGPVPKELLFLLGIVLIGSAGYRAWKLYRLGQIESAQLLLCLGLILPLLGSALVMNLKRGPWLGVIVGGLIFLFVRARRLILPFLAVILALAILVEPIRTRLIASYDHFVIYGGRSEIWEIGGELSLTYPLGIGYNNSSVLNQFSEEIPSDLRHFHSNILNILVEIGWLGLLLYLWWIIEIFRLMIAAYRSGSPQAPLSLGLGCGLISWQVAGLVEYNFGDREVFLVAMIVFGVLLRLSREEESGTSACA